MLLASATILTGREAGVLISAVAGGVLMLLESVEVVVIDRQSGNNLLLALMLQVFYLTLGLLIYVLAVSLWMAEFRQRHVPPVQRWRPDLSITSFLFRRAAALPSASA
jgi:hypothetical protein